MHFQIHGTGSTQQLTTTLEAVEEIPGKILWKILCCLVHAGGDEFTVAPHTLKKVMGIPRQDSIEDGRNHLPLMEVILIVNGNEIVESCINLPQQQSNGDRPREIQSSADTTSTAANVEIPGSKTSKKPLLRKHRRQTKAKNIRCFGISVVRVL